jgi:hypothetical protein
MLGLIYVEFFSVFNVCLNSRRWFMLCVVYRSYLVLVLVSGDRTSSVDWAQLCRFHLKTETIQSPKRYVLNKNRTMDNVQKHNNCINVPSSQTFRGNLPGVFSLFTFSTFKRMAKQ